jgi:ABC-2 type transport system permease protein
LTFCFVFAMSMSAFWSGRVHGLTGLGITLTFMLGGEAAPIAMLPGVWRGIGMASPFRAMLGFPAEIASGALNASDLMVGFALQFVWICVCAIAVFAIWRAGIRRFTAVGG